MTKQTPGVTPTPANYNAAVATQSAYAIRYTNHQSKRHIVVPVVMMVPGVHCGSAGPVLHTAEQLARHASAWNGIPVTIGHPTEDNQCVSANRPDIIEADVIGRVFNSYYDFANNKLRAEVWLDESALLSRQPALVNHLVTGAPMDVSIGAFTDDTPATGTYQGEQYIAVSSNYRPDHLALLPHEQGACSWNDGCGLRANSFNPYTTPQHNGGNPMEKQLWLAFQLMGLTLTPRVAPASFQANQQGYLTLIEQLQRKLDAMDSDAQYHYLEELFDDGTFIYRISPRDGRPAQYYKRGYTIDAAGAVVFADVVTQVRRQVDYVNVVAPSPTANAATPVMTRTRDPNGGNPPMTTTNAKPTAPAAPCANAPVEADLDAVMALNRFDAADRAWLANLTPQALARLVEVYGEAGDEPASAPVEPALEGEVDPAEKPVEIEMEPAVEPVEAEADPQANAAPIELAAYIAAAPEHLREQLNAGATLYQAHRAQLIKQVTSNTTVYAAGELEALSTDALEKLAAAIKAPADYSLRGGTALSAQADDNVLLPPGVKQPGSN